jgi:hypothetical protein
MPNQWKSAPPGRVTKPKLYSHRNDQHSPISDPEQSETTPGAIRFEHTPVKLVNLQLEVVGLELNVSREQE